MTNAFLEVSNGECVALKKIPHLSFDEFHKNALSIVKEGGKVVQYFACQDDVSLKLMAVLRTDKLLVASCEAPEFYPSLSQTCEPFHMFEREIAEQFGIRPEGHPWLKMVRYHSNYRNLPDVFGNDYKQDIPGNYEYYQVDGDEIHEVAVGPVHAGVIEPGHFRFNCIGERVLHLEIQLGYQHRAIENLFHDVQAKRLPILAESIAGDTAIGHSLCMAQAVESLTQVRPDKGARIIRTIALELERIANHIGDLGALSGDVAFLPPANYFGRMRGDFLNLSLLICGNRFGKGLVRPGGVRFSLAEEIRETLNERIKELKPQVEHVLDLLFSASTVRARFEDCGTVSTYDAEQLGLVGPAGRASGIPYDVRRCFPTEQYSQINIPENKKNTCDVYARAKIRYDEVLQSINIIQSLINAPVETLTVENINYNFLPSSFVVTLNEGWRGEVSHVILTDKDGKILRYKVKDPSFHNWNGLAMALRDTGISDFPLNNKSFNLSYCGFDL
ncbi:MAG: NADH-quinone oxidoreductase subunit C [Proteobacteria bacterium]|nr:NADH-quinone oxidoreductase subunit C [Pseudomonadota bacterium]MBU1581448.1 NADH-quinone oxidoreductase subunit C [Pseudomonadota bacterium]MBU2631406.1 NADH-quinone oxidoreductase subunit C [Pseudomonadota bacterium]